MLKGQVLNDGTKTTKLDTFKATFPPISTMLTLTSVSFCVCVIRTLSNSLIVQFELKIAAVHVGGEKSEAAGSRPGIAKDTTD